MNWSRVKTIFIILFLISDLFLLTLLAISDTNSRRISPEVIESTVSILKNNNIFIDSEIIPKTSKSIPYAEAENVIGDHDTFAKALLGDSVLKTGEQSYESDTGTLKIIGNSFEYNAKNFIGIWGNELNPQKVAEDFLQSINLNIENAKSISEKTETGYEVTFYNYMEDFPIFNSYVTVNISGKLILSAHGTWFNLIDSGGQSSPLKSVTSMLIDLIPEINTSSNQVTITDLSLGYNIPEINAYHKSAMLIPVWKITTDKNVNYFPDARNPQ